MKSIAGFDFSITPQMLLWELYSHSVQFTCVKFVKPGCKKKKKHFRNK